MGNVPGLAEPCKTDWNSFFRQVSDSLLHQMNADKLGRHVDTLLLATTKGDITAQEEWMKNPEPPPPTLGMAAAKFARPFSSSGKRLPRAYAVSTACSSGLTALADAGIRILTGDSQRIMVVGQDVITPFIRNGFAALKAVSPSGVCRPFDAHRDGLMLGTAAAGIVLEPATSRTKITLAGWGISNDAVHMTAPDREARGLCRAIENALRTAALSPADIDVVIAHATGTRYNDAMEAVAIERLFTASGATPFVTAAKGLLGHTLGASGIIESVMAILMLDRGAIPGIIGLRTPESSSIRFVDRTMHLPIRHVLKIASGFGGMNAAVIWSRESDV